MTSNSNLFHGTSETVFWLGHHQIPEPGLRHWWTTFFWRCFSCLRFDKALCTLCFRFERKKWQQENIDKFIMFQQMEKVLLFFACETSFGQNVCKIIQINPVKQPITCNSVVPWQHVSLFDFYLDYHFNDCFIVFKDVQLKIHLEKNVRSQEHDSTMTTADNLGFPCGLVLDGFERRVSCVISVSKSCFSQCFGVVYRTQHVLSPHPTNRGASDPSVSQSSIQWSNFRFSGNCEILMSAFSHIQQKENKMYDIRVYIRFPLMLIFFSAQSHQQNLSLEKSPIDNVVLHFPAWQTLTIVSCVMNVWNQSCPIVYSQACVHFVPDGASFVHQCRRTSHGFCLGFFSVAPAEMCDSDISLYCCIISVVRFAVALSASVVTLDRGNDGWFVKINFFHQFLSHGSNILLLSSHFDTVHVF